MYFEQRKYSRMPCRAMVRIYNDTSSWETTLVDVSRTGLQVRRPGGWLSGDHIHRCEVMIGKRFKMEIDATVAYCNKGFIGLYASHENLTNLTDLLRLMAIKSKREESQASV